MSSHSQFKKFNILHELEQAIKKKTQDKYGPNRSKSRTKYPHIHLDQPRIWSNLYKSNRPRFKDKKNPQYRRHVKTRTMLVKQPQRFHNLSTSSAMKDKEASKQKIR